MFSKKLKNKIKSELMERFLSWVKTSKDTAVLGFYEISAGGEILVTRVNPRHEAEEAVERTLQEAEELYCREYEKGKISTFCKENNITKDVMAECWIKLKFLDEVIEKNRRLRKERDKEIREELETMDKEIEKFKKAIKRLKKPLWRFRDNHSIFEDLYRVIEKLEQRKEDRMWLYFFFLGYVPKIRGRPQKNATLYIEDICWMCKLKLNYEKMCKVIKFVTGKELKPATLRMRIQRCKNHH
jgi:hypothetical protein